MGEKKRTESEENEAYEMWKNKNVAHQIYGGSPSFSPKKPVDGNGTFI